MILHEGVEILDDGSDMWRDTKILSLINSVTDCNSPEYSAWAKAWEDYHGRHRLIRPFLFRKKRRLEKLRQLYESSVIDPVVDGVADLLRDKREVAVQRTDTDGEQYTRWKCLESVRGEYDKKDIRYFIVHDGVTLCEIENLRYVPDRELYHGWTPFVPKDWRDGSIGHKNYDSPARWSLEGEFRICDVERDEELWGLLRGLRYGRGFEIVLRHEEDTDILVFLGCKIDKMMSGMFDREGRDEFIGQYERTLPFITVPSESRGEREILMREMAVWQYGVAWKEKELYYVRDSTQFIEVICDRE